MTISTGYLRRCIRTLEAAFDALRDHESDDVARDVYRAACVNSPWWNPASHRERRSARLTRREEGAYWAYATDEQRRQAGCIAARMQRGLSPRAVKQFELVLEQSGRLLQKRLRPWFASHRQADRLTFKDVFRHAAKHALIPADACERWLRYRDNRNTTAHDYGERFAEATLKLLPAFIADANALADVVEERAGD